MANFGVPIRLTNASGVSTEYNCIGAYRTAVRIVSTTAQAANSRIFEIRNTNASNLIVPTRLKLVALQTAAGTAQENSLDCYKVTGFSVVDTTNTVTPAKSTIQTAMPAYPGGTSIRHLTIAGHAAGMTGGTLTKDAQFFATLPYNVAAAINTTTQFSMNAFDGMDKEYPMVFIQNEGFIIENSILNATSYGMTWYLDFAWKELAAV